MSISPQGYNMGNKPLNENPFWSEGELDNVERIYATATETENSGSIAVEVSKRISGNNIYFDFNFQNIKGDAGQPGNDGFSPTVAITPTVDGNIVRITDATGSHSFDVKNGTDGRNGLGISNIEYDHEDLDGNKVYKIVMTDSTWYFITVPKGDKGDKGDTGATPNVTATATVDNTTGTPSVNVTKTGTAENPVINFAFTGIKGAQGEPGSGGSTVQCFPSGAIGTLIGTLVIDEVSYDLYAPGGSTIAVTPVQTTGTKIATISIDGVDTDLYAPNGGGGSTVSVNPTQSTGTKIATITVDGTPYDLYAPEELPDPSSANIGDVLTINAANQPVWQAPSGGGGVTYDKYTTLFTDGTYAPSTVSAGAIDYETTDAFYHGSETDVPIISNWHWNNSGNTVTQLVITNVYAEWNANTQRWRYTAIVVNPTSASVSWPTGSGLSHPKLGIAFDVTFIHTQ